MPPARALLDLVSLAALLGGCSSSSSGGFVGTLQPGITGDDTTQGQYCVTDTACTMGQACGYLVDGGCSAAGICVPLSACGGAGKQPTYCGCDGIGFVRTCGLPDGYAQAPIGPGLPYERCSLDAGGEE